MHVYTANILTEVVHVKVELLELHTNTNTNTNTNFLNLLSARIGQMRNGFSNVNLHAGSKIDANLSI